MNLIAQKLLESNGEEETTTTSSKEPIDFLDFIMAVEDGSITQEMMDSHAQAFVDSRVWRSLQGSWQRQVKHWVDLGIVTL